MGLKCGLVGLPNVGKSTLFNALTSSQVAADNFAFCTIEPNLGMVSLPDPRLEKIAKILNPAKIVPNTMEFVDIAGLVEGASAGEGLGNKFLAHIRETNAILHLVRCFAGEDINNTMASLDPLKAVEVINTELALSDIEIATNSLAKHSRKSASGDKEARILCNLLENKIIPHLDNGQPLRSLGLSSAEDALLRSFGFLTMKPVIYVLNIRGEDNHGIEAIEELSQKEGSLSIALDIKTEADLAVLDAEERKDFMQELKIEATALEQLILSSYRLLGLLTFFTAGPKELRAWSLRSGANAVEAAGEIHTDFMKHFIRAEVISYDDYLQYQGEQGAKKSGVWRLEGKDYNPKDGDIIYFRTSA